MQDNWIIYGFKLHKYVQKITQHQSYIKTCFHRIVFFKFVYFADSSKVIISVRRYKLGKVLGLRLQAVHRRPVPPQPLSDILRWDPFFHPGKTPRFPLLFRQFPVPQICRFFILLVVGIILKGRTASCYLCMIAYCSLSHRLCSRAKNPQSSELIFCLRALSLADTDFSPRTWWIC